MGNYSYEYGCCLSCPNAHPGCLCYSCKCTKCDHYICPNDWNGEKGKCGLCVSTPESRKAYAIKMSGKCIHIPDKKEITAPIIKPEDAFKENGVEC